MSATNLTSFRYTLESVFGTTPATPPFTELLRTDAGIMPKQDTVESKAVRSDRMLQGLFRVGRHSEGSCDFELAYAQFDDMIQAAFCGTFSTAVAISGTVHSADTTDDSINRSAGNYVTDGIQAGMWILVAGFVNAPNNGLFKVLAVTTTKLTFSAKITLATGVYSLTPNLTTEVAGPTVTIKNAGMLRNGTTERSFTFEQYHSAASQYLRATGCRIESLELAIQAKALITGKFGFKGQDWADDTAAIAGATLTSPNSNLAFNTASDIIGIAEGGIANAEIITAINFQLQNNLRMIDGVGSLLPQKIPYGTQRITGDLSLYLSSTMSTFLAKYRNFTESNLVFAVTNGASPFYYLLSFPAFKFSDRDQPAGPLDSDTIVKTPFTAYKGADGFQIQWDRISTT